LLNTARKRRLLTGTLSLAFLLVPTLAALGAADDTTLVSRVAAGAPADGDSHGRTSISADGRYVAYMSDADNLSDIDNNGVTNVFVRDTQTDETKLASRATGADGTGADAGSAAPSISPDGRFVAFKSWADNLSNEDNDSFANVFVRDLQSDTTTLVSRASGPGGPAADADSGGPSISDGGQFVAFTSVAANLVTDASSAVMNVFLRDMQTQETSLVSRGNPVLGMPEGPPGDGNSGAPSISANGQRIAFESQADNLSTKDDDRFTNVFVRNTVTRSTSLESCPTGTFLQRCTPPTDGNSFGASISATGQYVAFQSDADNLSAEDDDAYRNIFVRDTQASATTLVSRATGATGAPATGDSYRASISGDSLGRFVAFVSVADNLSDQDVATFDVFVRDVPNNTTTLVSRASGVTGAAAAGSSFGPSISSDGLSLAFWSEADNLSSDDNDAFKNVFVRDLTSFGAPPPPPPPPTPPECHHPPCDTTSGGSADPHGTAGHSATGSGTHDAGAHAPGTSHGNGSPHGGLTTGQTVVARSIQDVDNLLVIVVTHEDATLELTATVRMRGGSSKLYRFKPVTRKVAAHQLKRLRLRLPAVALHQVKRALRRDKRLSARITVTGKNASGTVTRARRTVRLKP
jgi:Tol biopolymer transport system component